MESVSHSEHSVKTNVSVDEENKEKTVSKNQMKKELKKKKWEEIKKLKKEQNKAKKKSLKKNHDHINRFKDLGKPEDESQKLSKKEKLIKFHELCQLGVKIIIDCDYEELMSDKEKSSLSKQLVYCYSTNKKAEKPGNIHLCGLKEFIKNKLEINGFSQWPIFHSSDSYLDLFPKKKLVYLSADSENLIDSLNFDDYYIIGGIVDHNRYKNLTIEKAKKEGIRHGKLPLAENININSCKVLTVNHVCEILVKQWNCNDWKKAILETVPLRKNATEKDENSDETQNKG